LPVSRFKSIALAVGGATGLVGRLWMSIGSGVHVTRTTIKARRYRTHVEVTVSAKTFVRSRVLCSEMRSSSLL
jgi:hypothetical protein